MNDRQIDDATLEREIGDAVRDVETCHYEWLGRGI